jgi:hypothetical protein
MPEVLTPIPRRGSRWFRWAMVSGLGVGLLALFLLARFWPFRLDAVIRELADESDSKVTVRSFRATYFPHPGCILDQVIFQHNPGSGTPPLITIKQLTIRGTSGLCAVKGNVEVFDAHSGSTLFLLEGISCLGEEQCATPLDDAKHLF